MTDYYLNSSSGSDSNGGTSEADAWASFAWAFGVTAGLTGGDYLWVKGGNTYSAKDNVLNTVSFEPIIHVYGYSSVTGDNCVDGELPEIIDDYYTGNSNIAYSVTKYDIRNFLFSLKPNNSYQRMVLPRLGHNITQNINIDADYSSTSNVKNTGCVTANGNNTDRAFQSYHVKLRNVTSGSASLVSDLNQLGTYADAIGCIFDCSDTDVSDSFIWGASNGYGTANPMSNVYIGNPNTSGMIGFRYNAGGVDAQGLMIENCVFYNLDMGIYATSSETSIHSSWLTTSNTAVYRFYIRNCIFVNCGTGIKFDTTSIPDWYHFNISDCIFYNTTTTQVDGCSNVSGSITATENPFDIDNMCLTDYGERISKIPYRKFGSESNPFSTTNTKKGSRYDIASPFFTTTDSGSFDGSTGGVGDTLTVSGRSYQLIQDNPRVWRRV